MKKTILVLCLLCLFAGCSKKEERTQNSDSNTNFSSNTSSNSSTNTSSNTNTNSNTNQNPSTEHYEVHLYLFHWNGCPHCQEELEWLSTIADKYSYLKIHAYEVEEYPEFDEKVRKAFGITGDSVPLTFIGNDYFIGFSETKIRKFENTIEEKSKTKLCDIVGTVLNDGDVDACKKQNEGK